MIEPMLQFDRQCELALEMYKKAFGAEVAFLMRFSDAKPQDRPVCYNAERDADLIFHAQMKLGGKRVLLCDNLFNTLPRGHTVGLVVMLETAEDVKAAFDILADGATIVSPISSATFTAAAGSLVDKFGIFWDLMVG